MRRCKDCGKAKSEENMVPKRNWCKLCRNEYLRKYNQTPKRKAYRKKNKNQANKRQVANLLSWYNRQKDQPCVDCKKKYHPAVMEWDHLPGFKKNCSVPQLLYLTKSKKKVQEEIAKCELVCANCHRMRTYFRRVGVDG